MNIKRIAAYSVLAHKHNGQVDLSEPTHANLAAAPTLSHAEKILQIKESVMGKFVCILIFAFITIPLSAGEVQCGVAKFQVDKSGERSEGTLRVTLKITSGDKTIIKKLHDDFIFVGCLQNPSNKRYFIVYQSYCSGSACDDAGNIGIVDPTSMTVLLKQSHYNDKKAETILGRELDTSLLNEYQ